VILRVFLTSVSYALRNRLWLVSSLLLPCLLFSVCVALSPGVRPATPKLPVLVLDAAGTQASRQLLQSLRSDPGLIVSTAVTQHLAGTTALEQAEASVLAGDHPMALVMLPDTAKAGVGAEPGIDAEQGAAPQIKVFSGNAFPTANAYLWSTLQKHAMTAVPDVLTQWSTRYLQSWVGELSTQQRATLEQRLARLSKQTPSANWQELQRMSGVLKVTTDDLSDDSGNPVIALYAAVLGLMCLLFAGSNAGASMLIEKQLGTLDRILSSQATMTDLLCGKLLYAVMFGCLQFLVLFLWAAAWFKLQLLDHLPGLLAVLIPTSVCCGAFGLMLSLRCRDRIVQGFVMFIVILLLSFMSGGIVPRVFMSETLQNVSLVAFNAWAIEGFAKVFWNNAGVLQLWPQMTALLGFTAVFLFLARQFARRWEYA